MIAKITTILDTTPEILWKEISKPQALQYVSKPLLFFTPRDNSDLSQDWEINKEYHLKLYLLKLIPLGSHIITIKKIDSVSNEIISNESGKLAKVWNHTIRFSAINSHQVKYSDSIEIKSGALTIVIWLFSNAFYRHRQRRWKKLSSQHNF